MIINNISIINEGYVYCRSSFYFTQDVISNCNNYNLYPGINILKGEIDSGNWAISYMLSMFIYRPKDFILFEAPEATINGKTVSLKDISKKACYMDLINPLLKKNKSVKKQITDGLILNKSKYSNEDIYKLFGISYDRFICPLVGTGNEIFKSMAAIGFSFNKDIYCFPWLSQKRFEGYHNNITELLELLRKLNKIVIIPVGNSDNWTGTEKY